MLLSLNIPFIAFQKLLYSGLSDILNCEIGFTLETGNVVHRCISVARGGGGAGGPGFTNCFATNEKFVAKTASGFRYPFQVWCVA